MRKIIPSWPYLWSIPFLCGAEARTERGKLGGNMPQRKGRILEVMELRRLQVEIARLRTLTFVVTRQSPSLGIAFAAAFHTLARECDATLREMMG